MRSGASVIHPGFPHPLPQLSLCQSWLGDCWFGREHDPIKKKPDWDLPGNRLSEVRQHSLKHFYPICGQQEFLITSQPILQ